MRKTKYRPPFKRRLEGKTNYVRRLALLRSNLPRLIVRKSLKHMKTQIIKYYPSGDKVLTSATSEELEKFGWNGSTSNIPASYLVGFLIGKRALKRKTKKAVLDIGIQKNIKGSRISSVLRGAIDAGLEIPASPNILTSDERIKGQHIVDFGRKLKNEDKQKYKIQFSKSNPEKTLEVFEKTKSNIIKGSV